MNLSEHFQQKAVTSKDKVKAISGWLLNGLLCTDDLITFALATTDKEKASCIEAIEFATRENPELADKNVFVFVTKMLNENAPRIKWESARVLGNIAHLYPAKLNKPIKNLLENAKHESSVVRWTAASALGEIMKLNSNQYNNLLPALKTLCEKETDSGIRKKYLAAFQQIKS